MLACDGSHREQGPRPLRDPDHSTGMDGTLEGTSHGIMCGEASDEDLMARVAAAGDHAAVLKELSPACRRRFEHLQNPKS